MHPTRTIDQGCAGSACADGAKRIVVMFEGIVAAKMGLACFSMRRDTARTPPRTCTPKVPLEDVRAFLRDGAGITHSDAEIARIAQACPQVRQVHRHRHANTNR